MSEIRSIHRVSKSRPTLEGAGVHLRRVFGFGDPKMFDPFLLLDDFRSDKPDEYLKGFPWHPHRGIETITYMLEGAVEHGDSMGNSGVIQAGDVQWMTAGSGIIHQEMPKGDPQGRMYGFQLWANLPAASKMMPPRYQEVKRSQIPVVALPGGGVARVIAGEVDGRHGPVTDIIISPAYLDVTLPAGSRWQRPTPRGHKVFAYIYDGSGKFCEGEDPFTYPAEGQNYFDLQRSPWLESETLALFEDGEAVSVTAGGKGVSFLLISGKPLNEPVAWYGPIVMNTQEELRIAFDDLQKGTFIK